MKVAFLGATGGIGRALARRMARRGDRLVLMGRDEAALRKSAADLALHREGSVAGTTTCDLERPDTFEPALDAAERALGGLDAVVVTAGAFATQERLEADAALAGRILAVDFTNTVLFCEAARRRLLAGGGGTLCAFSSVAGDRGRSPVVLYGSAKAGLSRYLEGLDHRYHRAGLRTVCVKPGFVRTAMTAELAPPPFASDPDRVAAVALRAIDRGRPVVYAPGIWRCIMATIAVLPRAVMRRVEF